MKKKNKLISKVSKKNKVKKVHLFALLVLFLSAIISVYFVSKATFNEDPSSNAYAAGTSWFDDFNGASLDTNFWNVSSWSGLGSITNSHQGIFQPDRVSVVGGYLILKLTQENGRVGTNNNGVISRGGEVGTKDIYGYGTYEWRARMSSTASSPTDTTGQTVSGQISGLFNYVNNSQTELDFEVQGQSPNKIENTTWYNTHPSTSPTDSDQAYSFATVYGMNTEFKTYKYIWSPGEVKYYVDDVLVGDHTTHVPSAPANVMINHWGTNSTNFGGLATVGVDRYLIIDWVRYTAPDASPSPSSVIPTPTQGIAPTSTPTATPTSAPIPTFTPTPTPTSGQTINLLQNGSFENNKQPWYFALSGNARGTFSLDTTNKYDGASSAKVNITKSNSSNSWYIQLGQNNVKLNKSQTYNITFWAKSSNNRQGQLVIQLGQSPWTQYYSTNFSTTTSWKQYSFNFSSPVTVSNAEFNFNLAQSTGQVWIDNVIMK